MTTVDLFNLHHSFIGREVPDAEAARVYHEDVVMEFPYAPRHHTGRREGRAAVQGFLANIGKYFRDIQLGSPVIHETIDPNLVIVEYPGSSISNETNLPYRQNYVAFVTARDGRIAHIREYYDPIPVLVSTGEIPDPSNSAA